MRFWVLFLIVFIFISLLIGYNLYSSFKNFGELVYPLDDAYIHMAISKNLQQHGVWGVTRFNFSSTSSSLLYTLSLALGFAIFGIKTWLPLAINWIAAAAIVWLTLRISLRFMNAGAALFFNLLFVLLVPVSGMAVLGMEHSFQIFFCMLFAWQSYRKWNNEKVNDLLYAITALLAVATRYESVFLIGLVGAVWLFVFRNWKQVIFLAIAAALPVVIFGIYSIFQGGYFVPNSLLAKSNYVNGGLFGFITEVSKKILNNSLLAALMFIPLVYYLLFPVRSIKELRSKPAHILILVIAMTTILHQVFASFGWMFRYEAYLLALMLTGFAITYEEWKNWFMRSSSFYKLITMVLAVVVLLPVLIRVQIPSFANRAMKNIHDQHLQMAAFVHENFPSSGIAMNDIGTTTFFNDDMRLFDMEGLGTLEILKVKKQFDSSFLKEYVSRHNIEIGIFYPHLYQGKIPADWEMVGSWEISEKFVAAGSLVGFYAIAPGTKEKLIKALRDYADKLPKDVHQKGQYLLSDSLIH